MWRRAHRRSHQAVTPGSPSVRYSVHNEHASSRGSTALHKHTPLRGSGCPCPLPGCETGARTRRMREPCWHATQHLFSSEQCVVPTVRGFFMFNTVTNSWNYMPPRLQPWHGSASLRSLCDRPRMCVRCAPEVSQKCPAMIRQFFFKGVLLGLQRHIFIVFHPSFRTCSRFCRHVFFVFQNIVVFS